VDLSVLKLATLINTLIQLLILVLPAMPNVTHAQVSSSAQHALIHKQFLLMEFVTTALILARHVGQLLLFAQLV
jgi:hypothetical protein